MIILKPLNKGHYLMGNTKKAENRTDRMPALIIVINQQNMPPGDHRAMFRMGADGVTHILEPAGAGAPVLRGGPACALQQPCHFFDSLAEESGLTRNAAD